MNVKATLASGGNVPKMRIRMAVVMAALGAVAAFMILPAAVGALAAVPASRALLAATPPLAKGSYKNVMVPRAKMTMAEDIADSGLIVGCFQRKTGPERGFTDMHGRFTFITHRSITGRSSTTCALSANSLGVIVGYYANRSGVIHGFVYQKGIFTTINAPGAGRRSGEGTSAIDINKAGVIVGLYITSKDVVHGFVLSHGKFTRVDDPNAAHSSAGGTFLNGVADDGTMSGGYTDASQRSHGFWLRQGKFHQVDVPGARNTFVGCISDRSGLLVGGYQIRGHRRLAGFTYHHGVFRTLRDPSATGSTDPQCANDRSRVVGFYTNTLNVTTGFRFTPGTSPAAVPGVRAGSGEGRLPSSPRIGRP
jgi:hypothetical protein